MLENTLLVHSKKLKIKNKTEDVFYNITVLKKRKVSFFPIKCLHKKRKEKKTGRNRWRQVTRNVHSYGPLL